MAELPAVRGDAFREAVTVRDLNGALFDFSGCTVWWTLKDAADRADNDDSAIAALYWQDGGSANGLTIDDRASGIVSIRMTAAQTNLLQPYRRYVYDIQVVDSAIGPDPFTVDFGTVAVTLDVTRRTTAP